MAIFLKIRVLESQIFRLFLIHLLTMRDQIFFVFFTVFCCCLLEGAGTMCPYRSQATSRRTALLWLNIFSSSRDGIGNFSTVIGQASQ